MRKTRLKKKHILHFNLYTSVHFDTLRTYRFHDWKQHHQLCRDNKLTPVHLLAIESLCIFMLVVKIYYVCDATCTFLFIKETWYLRKNPEFGTKKFAAAAMLLFPRLVPRLFLHLSTARHQTFLMYQNMLVWCLENCLQHWVSKKNGSIQLWVRRN